MKKKHFFFFKRRLKAEASSGSDETLLTREPMQRNSHLSRTHLLNPPFLPFAVYIYMYVFHIGGGDLLSC